MNKETLRTIGKVIKVIDEQYTIWVRSGHKDEDAINKVNLARRIMRNLEEQKRGLLKSDLPYQEAAKRLVEISERPYNKVHDEIAKILLSTGKVI
jgi:hypothetical protein